MIESYDRTKNLGKAKQNIIIHQHSNQLEENRL